MTTVTVDYDVPVAMRDGTILRADVYRPGGEGPWPVVVARTPYGKSDHYELQFLEPLHAARRGFIAVVQDVRGRFASDGDFVPFVNEADDGFDTVEWAAKLPGSTGAVGMWGLSYLGNAQWLAASRQPPSLRAIAPERTFRDPRTDMCYRGGAYELGLVRSWGIGVGFDLLARRHRDDEQELSHQILALADAANGLPGATYSEPATDKDEVIARQQLPNLASPESMQAADVRACQSNVQVPSLHVAGWYDIFLQGTIDNYLAAAQNTPAKLVIGPWNHIGQGSLQGDINFGLAGNGYAIDLETTILDLTFDWLQEWFSDEPADVDPPVRLYVMGINQWRSEREWPLTRAVDTQLFLTAQGDVVRALDEHSHPEPLTYRYDPADPVPTLGGNIMMAHPMPGSYDQQTIEARPDVLVFTSESLAEDVEVTGRVTATLAAATDGVTTDWVVRLCDVHPDGRSFNVVDGITRVEGAPGEVMDVDVDLLSTSIVFKKGHRIRVQVTSSCFPRWDRNPNAVSDAAGVRMRAATQTLHTGMNRRSYVTLPIVPPSNEGADAS